MLTLRLCKIMLLAGVALFFSLVAFGNITDYDSNWQFVQHVLSMDTTFANSTIRWRAVANPTLQTLGYGLIILVQTVIAILLWIAVVRLLINVRSDKFGPAKAIAVLGLTLGLLLYLVGFIAIGGEWFAMWQSQIWNGEQKAFDFISMIGIVMLIMFVPDESRRAST